MEKIEVQSSNYPQTGLSHWTGLPVETLAFCKIKFCHKIPPKL